MSHTQPAETTMEQTDEGPYIRLRVRLKRGSEVRNEDDVTGEIVVRDLDELKENLDEFTEMLYTQASRARAYQP